jgi:integrase
MRDIVPSEEDLMALGRRRYQRPGVFRTRGGRPEWYFRARVDVRITSDGAPNTIRREQTYYLGYCDEIGKREAEKRRDEILETVVNTPQINIPSQVKLSEVLEIYKRDHLRNLRETTRVGQENVISKHIAPGLGHLRLCDIDLLAIQRWLANMDAAQRTRRKHLRVLRTVWGRAEEWGFVQRSFPRGKLVCGGTEEVKGKDLPPLDQLRRLLAALEDPWRAMAEVALYCGLRISEIRGLKWQDVSSETLTIARRMDHLGGIETPKGRKRRVLDVRPVASVLARLPHTSEWIFPECGSYVLCQRRIVEARELAGITVPLFGWHHLRAACNTLMRSSGADAIDRRATLGHSDDETNEIYVHATPEDRKRRGDLMMAVREAIMGQTKGVQ